MVLDQDTAADGNIRIKVPLTPTSIKFPATGSCRLTSQWIDGRGVCQVMMAETGSKKKKQVPFESIPSISEGFALRFKLTPVSESKVTKMQTKYH